MPAASSPLAICAASSRLLAGVNQHPPITSLDSRKGTFIIAKKRQKSTFCALHQRGEKWAISHRYPNLLNSTTIRALGRRVTTKRRFSSFKVIGSGSSALRCKSSCWRMLGKAGLPIDFHSFKGEP